MDQLQQIEPLKVALTVISGRNFQGKKKGDQCHASVVFGLGKDLYQTEEIQSNEPYWNQEALVNVAGKASESLIFKIKDQGHTVGVVKIPIKTISRKKREEWHSIQPYKKEKDFNGEIRLSCFVFESRPIVRPELTPPISSSSINTSSSEDTVPHSDKKKGLFHSIKLSPQADNDTKGDSECKAATSQDVTSILSDEDNGLVPEVTGISPNEGSIQGNVRVTLRGSNLGESKEDIVRVTIANVDCTNSFEYFSSGKLIVTTPPRKVPGKGPVIIETHSGGVGISALHYSYVSPPLPNWLTSDDDQSTANVSHSPLQSRKPKLSDQEISEIQSENRFMKQQLKELKESNKVLQEDNTALKEYIEQLLSTILEHKPEILEIAQRKIKTS